MLSNFSRFNLNKLCVVAFHFLFVVSAFAQTPGYQKITWDDLLNVEWYQQMKKDMASYGRMAFLKDGSEEAEKLMASMRTKLDEAPISTKIHQSKNSHARLCSSSGCCPKRTTRVFIGPIFWCLHTHTASRQPIKSYWSHLVLNSTCRNHWSRWT
jgi:hypothetical protein